MVIKRETREQARQLRTQGVSIIAIAEQLSVAKSSVSHWVRDIELTPEQIENLKQNQHRTPAQLNGAKSNYEKALANRKMWQEEGRIKAREGQLLHMTGCMLYWAEGAKSRNSIIFVNSDSEMMKLFIRFLREELKVLEEQLIIILHCHNDNIQDHERIKNYWLDTLKLTEQNMRNINVKKGSDSRKNRLNNGICTLRVYSTQLTMHIYGAIQEYGKFERPEWLF